MAGLTLRAPIWLFVTAISVVASSDSPSGQTVDLGAEIAALKRTISDQGTRIAQLEMTVLLLRGEIARLRPAAPPPPPQAPAPSSSAPRSFSPAPWTEPLNWGRIKAGMSEAQVVSILGPPTSVESVYGRKLFYKGSVAGSVPVTGYIWLVDDRVTSIEKPVF